MREIQFRGKRKDNGEWVFGDFVSLNDGARVIPHIYGCGEIILSTVGQYTGLTDKNGKKIFEHDILQMYTIWADGHCEKAGFVVVLFSMNDQAYILCNSNNTHDLYDDFGNYGKPEYYEVLGNIHDNPELLEVSGDE